MGSTGYGSKQRVVVGLSILALGVAALFTGLFGHVSSAFLIVGARRAAGLPRRVGAGPDDRAAAEPGDRRSAAPNKRRDRHPGPGEHHAQPQAHRGQRVRADDRGRPDRVHLDLRLLDQGVDQRDHRPDIRRGLRDQLRRRVVGRRRPRAGPAAERAPAGGRGHRGTHRVHADPRPANHDRGGRSPHGRRRSSTSARCRGRSAPSARTASPSTPDDATKHHLTLGSPVSVVFRDTGPKTLRVALIYGDNQAAPSANPGSKTSYFLGTPGYDANFAAPHYDTQVFVKKAPGVSTAAALAAVKKVAAQYAPGTTVQDQAAYKAEQTKGDQPDTGAHLHAARAGDRHRAARHRQHARAVDLRTHPRARRDARGGDDAPPAPRHDPLGVGDHRPAGHVPRPAGRGVLRLGARPGPEEPGNHRVQRAVR